MASHARDLLLSIAANADTSDGLFYNVKSLDKSGSFRVGRSSQGNAVILISTRSPSTRAIPLQLSGIEAIFDINCSISEAGSRTDAKFTVIKCISAHTDVEAYFAHIADIMLDQLGEFPHGLDVEDAIAQLVSLFEQLKSAPRKNVIGILGELLVIDCADHADSAVLAWHNEHGERFDFAGGNVRLEAKSSSNGRRQHTFSAEQVNLPADTLGVLASVLIEESTGGISVGEFVRYLEKKLSDADKISKFRLKLARSLGLNLGSAMEYNFDLPRARATIEFYDLLSVPAVRQPYPKGVSSITFASDLSQLDPYAWSTLNKLIGSALGFCVARRIGEIS